MKTEILETLLLDHALGALSPEVAALLEAHLAHDPAAARRAAELTETLRLARAAVAAPLEPPRKSLDVERLRQAQRHQRSSTRRTEILRLAACLLLGLGLGWLIRITPATEEHAARPIAVAPLPALTPEPPLHFWSIARIAPGASEAENSRRLRWTSPAGVPRTTSIQ
ncbi:MAG: hypothetical protein HY736_13015 [Verrucomicrobia bacterium]|nr:hypothetical protein [Verrucomicrobiota bacterium]